MRNPFLFGRNGCHWGQLKLFYTELEFLTMAAAKHDLSKCTVVSVGAAPGHSVSLLRRMFPDLHFILIDPARFVAKVDSHVKILNTFFTDDTVQTILQDSETQGRTLLFISDIRVTVDDSDGFEESVFADMLSQQRWSVELGAAMSMFKFRMPFADSKTGPRDMRYDYTLLKGTGSKSHVAMRKGVPKDPSTVPKGTMVYLDGDIRLQLYPPSNSAETRLIVQQAANKKYMLRAYDYTTYESTMNHFNSVTRCATYAYPHGALLAEHIAGFDAQSYECASEAWIVSEYLRVVKDPGKASKTQASPKAKDKGKEVAEVLFAIHCDMWQVTQRSILTCRLGTPLPASKPRDLDRKVALLMRDPQAGILGTVSGMRRAVETAVEARTAEINAQLSSFAEKAILPQASSPLLLLRRTQYLSQMAWMRAELAQIQRLRLQYLQTLDRVSPGQGQGAGRGRGRGHHQQHRRAH